MNQAEITKKEYFKGYWEDVNIPETWANVSWHNDTCPSWSVNGYQVFVDHPVADQRELHPCPRFYIIREEEYGEGGWNRNTDDWDEVLKHVR